MHGGGRCWRAAWIWWIRLHLQGWTARVPAAAVVGYAEGWQRGLRWEVGVRRSCLLREVDCRSKASPRRLAPPPESTAAWRSVEQPSERVRRQRYC